ncbi:MFS transporter [Penicillium canescens]|uniref:MFS transporter n=1 Tax=Penicillium canescens TaxID=5083 RepID=A0AAD6IAK1_PENCN|nr:MFS transporter [Penicillium canescens]XP_058369588.1 MFS transporter [Penicillium canescens]KAJ5991655.1 MFS transporter [Penicillium canescens]KAJ6002349.1 MFS transporter [Penicillium canescens]KAJ6035296.1 MFS transporter [Penicillium canescens]KAJ6037424.1 MFS transporter [Penicillium canescens]KAJ6038638.1 MFS transporter [Penicillium canescens]
MAPPYLFPVSSVGLMQISAIIGFTLSTFGGGYVCDLITARMTKRNRGVFVPELRLVSMGPIHSLGLLAALSWHSPVTGNPTGHSSQSDSAWVSSSTSLHLFSLCLTPVDPGFDDEWADTAWRSVAFGAVYAPNVAVTYLVDCYPAFASEVLVIVNVAKNAIGLVFLYVAVDWVQSKGWIQVYMIIFMVVSLPIVLTIPSYFWGDRARSCL